MIAPVHITLYHNGNSVARQGEVWHRAKTNSTSISSSSDPASGEASPPFDWWKKGIEWLSWRWDAVGLPTPFRVRVGPFIAGSGVPD